MNHLSLQGRNNDRFKTYFMEGYRKMESENKMAYKPINKLILQMSAPPLISMFLQYSYNLVDSMFVAKINEQALTAVSLSFPITTLMNALSIWIGVGVNVLIAGYLGQNNQEKADSATTLGLILSFIIGVIVNISALFFIKPYYAAFTENNVIFEYGISYMKICTYMQIPNMVHITIQLLRQGILLLPLMWLLNNVWHINGIWIAFPVTEFIVCMIAGLLIRHDIRF